MQQNLTEGSVIRKLTMFALPFLVSNVVQSLYNVADMLIVGNFCGPSSMSGVNIGGQIVLILTNIVIGLCMGATVLIGQYVGSKNPEALKKTTTTVITILPLIALGITAVMLFCKEPLLRLIQTPADSFAESNSYLTVSTIGLVFIFGYNALSAILRGMGDSRRPLYFVLAACIINVGLDLLFVGVFGWKAFGAALATVISQAGSMLLCIVYIKKNDFPFDFKLSSFKIYKDELKLIIKIGLPSSIQHGIVSISFLFLTAVVNIVGGIIGGELGAVNSSAAVGAVSKFNSFVFMPTLAISSSVSTMCAQSIGANRFDRALKVCCLGTLFSFIISGLIFVLVQLFPGAILSIFGDDKQVIEYGVSYLRAMSYDFLIIPFTFCLNGLFMGGGHTMFTLISNVSSSVLLRVPLCWLFGVTLGWNLKGVGLGIPVATFGTLIFTVAFFLTGKWKHNKVSPVAQS